MGFAHWYQQTTAVYGARNAARALKWQAVLEQQHGRVLTHR